MSMIVLSEAIPTQKGIVIGFISVLKITTKLDK